jgi:nucleoside-diphosphate-sugar epimerase
MSETVLITGGAGFIGRFVTEELLRRGNKVRVLDALIEQVHGDVDGLKMLNPEAELIRGDVRDKDAVAGALKGVDSVVHLAAEVGVGQSMYEVERYTSTNDVGTAVLFEKLIDNPVRRVVTASSMSIYGEGLYRDADGALVEDAERHGLKDGLSNWEPVDAQGHPLAPVATPEWKRPNLASIYALNKYVQERTTHIMAAPYGIEGVCLRLFNVYGPGQALSNPYTGVLAIFASRLLNGQQPMIFEDGEQRRDFVHVTARPPPPPPAPWARMTSHRSSSARRGSAISATASATPASPPSSLASARSRISAQASPNSPNGWRSRPQPTRSKRCAPSWKRGAWSRERCRIGRARPDHRRRRVHRLQPCRPAGGRRLSRADL